MSGANDVVVHLYDLSMGMARQFSHQFLGKQIDGIWHTGVVVYGREYYFGGGIFDDVPGRTPYGNPIKQIPMGSTAVPKEIFEEFLAGLYPRYNMSTYNLLTNNCNNFSNDVCNFLTGQSIPDYITGLPEECLNTPMGQMFKPMIENMQNNILQQASTHETHLMPGGGGGLHLADLAQALGGMGGLGAWNQQQMLQSQQQSPYAPSTTATTTTTSATQQPVGHRHTHLPLNHLRHSTPVLLNSGAENAVKIVAKLKEFVEEAKKGGVEGVASVGEADYALLEKLQDALKEKDKLATANIAAYESGVYEVLRKLVFSLPLDKLFPCLDVMRLLVLVNSANVHYATAEANTILEILNKFVTKRDRSLVLPKGVLLMVFRLAANMFSTSQGAAAMLDSERLGTTIDVISESVLSSDASCRLAGSTLAYNCSLHLAKSNVDAVTQIISALVHALGQKPEERSGDECDFIMLMALGHLLYTNDEGVELTNILGLDLSGFLTSKTLKVAAVAAEVQKLL